jgi:hypothetical protein
MERLTKLSEKSQSLEERANPSQYPVYAALKNTN